MQCLLIDDDVPTVNVLRDFVDWDAIGISSILMAHNIADAKMFFETHIPDIIVCDIEMPKGSGLEMIEWVREHHFDCSFIFFTCHESFDFASTAISFQADAYVIKPFDKDRLESSLIKAANAVKQRRELSEYSRYGQTWLKNRDVVEQAFWRDILFSMIPPRMDFIHSEMGKRGLDIPLEATYVLALITVSATDMEIGWNYNMFKFAFHNLCSELMYGMTDHPQVITYKTDPIFYTAIVIGGVDNIDTVKAKCEALIDQCHRLLRCTATAYLAGGNTVSQLASIKLKLEEMDKKNIILKGKVLDDREAVRDVHAEPYTLDISKLNHLFVQGERVKIVNMLKNELETLASLDRLDLSTMHAIHQDFLQAAYSLLNKNNIQAHKLFSDETSQQLAHMSAGSIFEFMKWANYVTNKTINYLKEVIDSEGVVEKCKRFIHAHYDQDLSREDIAAAVYLTPDYLAKRFKQETGLSVKEYLNEYRIQAASEMLIQRKESVGEIATRTGFDSISYFSTVFKKVTGETPNAFRARHKA